MRNPDPDPFITFAPCARLLPRAVHGEVLAMESLPPVEVTRLLARARAGDAQAMGSAYSAVYDELKRAARLQLRRMQDNF